MGKKKMAMADVATETMDEDEVVPMDDDDEGRISMAIEHLEATVNALSGRCTYLFESLEPVLSPIESKKVDDARKQGLLSPLAAKISSIAWIVHTINEQVQDVQERLDL